MMFRETLRKLLSPLFHLDASDGNFMSSVQFWCVQVSPGKSREDLIFDRFACQLTETAGFVIRWGWTV